MIRLKNFILRLLFIKLMPFISPIRSNFSIKIISYGYSKLFFKKCGNNLKIKAGVMIDCPENITAGDNLNIGEYSFLSAIDEIIFGNNVLIGHFCSILTANHEAT